MSLRDYYLYCRDCKERQFVTADRIAGSDPVPQEVGPFCRKHYGHAVRLVDEEYDMDSIYSPPWPETAQDQ
jgi:hypothetical protein